MEQLRLTADKREIKDSFKFACRRTSFIRRTLYEMAAEMTAMKNGENNP